MSSRQLIIVFAKNLEEGQVKTRLAKSIGNHAALEVYKELLITTEFATINSEIETWVFYSKQIDKTLWSNSKKFVQFGEDLGQKMKHAFELGFNAGYQSIILIGSDLPDMNEDLLAKAFSALSRKQTVFGPAEDGGYYLVGLNAMVDEVFINKPWSKSNLLNETLQELQSLTIDYGTLELLNDIDTIEDLVSSGFLEKKETLKQTIASYND